jgi:hypothetical protein
LACAQLKNNICKMSLGFSFSCLNLRVVDMIENVLQVLKL